MTSCFEAAIQRLIEMKISGKSATPDEAIGIQEKIVFEEIDKRSDDFGALHKLIEKLPEGERENVLAEWKMSFKLFDDMYKARKYLVGEGKVRILQSTALYFSSLNKNNNNYINNNILTTSCLFVLSNEQPRFYHSRLRYVSWYRLKLKKVLS